MRNTFFVKENFEYLHIMIYGLFGLHPVNLHIWCSSSIISSSNHNTGVYKPFIDLASNLLMNESFLLNRHARLSSCGQGVFARHDTLHFLILTHANEISIFGVHHFRISSTFMQWEPIVPIRKRKKVRDPAKNLKTSHHVNVVTEFIYLHYILNNLRYIICLIVKIIYGVSKIECKRKR